MYHGEYTDLWNLGLSSLRDRQDKSQSSPSHSIIHLCFNSDIQPTYPVLFSGNTKPNNPWSLHSVNSQSNGGDRFVN